MLLWHVGAGAALVYLTLGRRRIDYRLVALGAVVPDVIDAAFNAAGVGRAGRGPAHSLSAVIAVALAVVLAVRDKQRRLALFSLPVGWLTHLVVDAVWVAPATFYWPAFGTAFGAGQGEPYSAGLLLRPHEHLSTWGAELAGALVIVWFALAFGLNDPARRARFLRDGQLRA